MVFCLCLHAASASSRCHPSHAADAIRETSRITPTAMALPVRAHGGQALRPPSQVKPRQDTAGRSRRPIPTPCRSHSCYLSLQDPARAEDEEPIVAEDEGPTELDWLIFGRGPRTRSPQPRGSPCVWMQCWRRTCSCRPILPPCRTGLLLFCQPNRP